MGRPLTEAFEDFTEAETTDGVDGVTGAFVFFLDERTRDTLVETAGTSAEEAVIGNGSGDGSRIPFLFLGDLADDRLVGTTEDAPAEITTAVGDVDDTTSDTTSIVKVVAMTTDEPGIGAASVRTGGTGAIVGGGTDTVAEDRRVFNLGSDAAGEVGPPATLDCFGRAESFGALTFLDDAIKRLVSRGRTAPTFRRDLAGGNTDGDTGRVRAGVTWDCTAELLATASPRR